MNWAKKIYQALTKPPEKFYSDWSPLQRAYWGLWKRPADCFTLETTLKLNKDMLDKIYGKK